MYAHMLDLNLQHVCMYQGVFITYLILLTSIMSKEIRRRDGMALASHEFHGGQDVSRPEACWSVENQA